MSKVIKKSYKFRNRN